MKITLKINKNKYISNINACYHFNITLNNIQNNYIFLKIFIFLIIQNLYIFYVKKQNKKKINKTFK